MKNHLIGLWNSNALACIIRRMSYGNAFGKWSRFAGITLVATLLSMFVALAISQTSGADTSYDADELRFLELINEYREQNGLGDLILSDDITVAAEHHNEDMAAYDFFAHDTAQSSYYPVGSQPWDRMAAEGYDYNTFKGENLAVGYETAEEAMQAWKDSPSHNSAMLDGNYEVIGISRIQVPGSRYEWYWTTDFGAYEDPSSHAPGETPGEQEEPEDEREDVIRNGGFENEKAWRQDARDGAKLILAGELVRLGDYGDGRDELSQKVQVGRDATLSYGLKVSTSERREFSDELRVRLTDEDGRRVALLRTHTGEDAGNWQREKVRIDEKYAGETLFLDFLSTTDGEDDTTFLLDNVALVY